MSWIKVEKTTPDKPEIRKVADDCHVDVDRAFTAWFRLWSWLDGETPDGAVRFLTPKACDDVGRLPGLGNALSSVGWIEFHDEGAFIVGWEKHNGTSAKRRAQDAKRQEDHRDRSGKDSGYRPWRKRVTHGA